MHTCSKTYTNLPAAHRQPEHDGHCALIHGHNWGFQITFACQLLDDLGFVVDFGKLKFIKAFLEDSFDHTLLLNATDPELNILKEALGSSCMAKIVVVPNCSSEKLAEYVFYNVQRLLEENMPDDYSARGRRLRPIKVTCFEDDKNSATFTWDGA